jgi:hypothetical protein
MQSSAKIVPTHLKGVLADRRAALKQLRDLCRTILTDSEETMDYGGPSYKRDSEVEVGFASQKHFIGLHTLCSCTERGRASVMAKAVSITPNPSGSISPETSDGMILENCLWTEPL